MKKDYENTMKTGMQLYNSFSNTYLSLGGCVGKDWDKGKKNHVTKSTRNYLLIK